MKSLVSAMALLISAGCVPDDDITFHCIGSDKVYKNRGNMMYIESNHQDCIERENP